MGTSNISYLKDVWNPYSQNCIPVSEGCKHCYARVMQDRFGGSFVGSPTWRTTALKLLREIKSPSVIGINFLSDTWHEAAPLEWIQTIHQMIAQRPADVFVYTTKRAERMAKEAHLVEWPGNLWVGVSVELRKYLGRIDYLRDIPAAHRWVSFEPLLSEIGAVNLTGIDWIATGAESGEGYRPFQPAWALNIIHQAEALYIPVYHKQGSGRFPGSNRDISGRTYDAIPFLQPVISNEQLNMF